MDCNQYVEYLKDSVYIADFHCHLESSLSFVRLKDDNYAAAFHYYKQFTCITFAKLYCKSLASLKEKIILCYYVFVYICSGRDDNREKGRGGNEMCFCCQT